MSCGNGFLVVDFGFGLQSGGVAHDVTTARAGGGFPAWAGAIASTAGIEPEPGDCHENVAVADVDGDPFAFAFFAIFKKSFGGGGAFHETSFAQDVRRCAGAIVAVIVMARVAAAPLVGFVLQSVAGCDRALDGWRGVSRGIGDAIFQHGGAAVIETIGDRLFCFHLAGAGNLEADER